MKSPRLKNIAAVLVALIAIFAAASDCYAALSLSADSAGINLGPVTMADVNLGFVELTASDLTYALRLTVIDDVSTGWIVKTKAETSYFSSFGSVKPCSDLRWRPNGSGIYSAYTTTDAIVATGDGDAVIDMDFKVLTGWNDAPGAYSINVLFTIFEN